VARRAIDAGDVLVNGAVADKPARQVLPGDAIVITAAPAFVGRGGEKLTHALDVFSIDPSGCVCLDVGSSTGGFTDCLLQADAKRVVALDVGTAQLHERLRADDRVDVWEQTDVRSVSTEDLGGPFDLVVCDVSFIGLDMVLPTMLDLLAADGLAVVLVKPQFEAGRQEASRGKGVIRDPEIWQRVLLEVIEAATRLGAAVLRGDVSPLKGGSGNVEFLFLIRGWSDDCTIEVEALVRAAQELD